MMAAVVFFAVAFLAFLGALALVFHRHPMVAGLGMALSTLSIGVLYVLLRVPFLGLFQAIIYAGAVMVIVLYIVMALGREETGPRVGSIQTGLTYAAAALLLLQFYWAIVRSGAGPFPEGSALAPVTSGGTSYPFGTIQAFGSLLVSHYSVPFEVASLLLVGAMVGAVILSRRSWS